MHNHTQDTEIFDLITAEENRQNSTINLIPSENMASEAVRSAVGSILANKYSEGNIGKRYYEGNKNIDEIESLAQERAKKLFKLPESWSVNVQALSGSYANLAVYLACLQPGDTILSMYLPDGGHLSHGWSYEPGEEVSPKNPIYTPGERKVHIVSKLYNVVQYKTDPETHLLDYDQIAEIAKQYQPKMIITGGTAYPRDIDYKKMKAIAEEVGALYMADIAHEAGLIGAGSLPSPVGVADVVTLTTHKTLRAARGSMILAHEDIIKKVNRAVLPGMQGGPFNNNIAGIAVGLQEALQPEFKEYTDQIIKNSKALATGLKKHGFNLITGGTDKHLILLDVSKNSLSGKDAAKKLASAGIVANMNTIPGETGSPANPSGLRFGTPFVTTQGMKESEMQTIADWIYAVLLEDVDVDQVRVEVEKFMTTIA